MIEDACLSITFFNKQIKCWYYQHLLRSKQAETGGINPVVQAFFISTDGGNRCSNCASTKRISDIGELFATLSDRQQQVVTLLHKGLSNKEIAVALGVSEGTIKCHLHSIYEKLGAQSRIELMIMFSNSTKLQSADN